jgi:hypothetical protein
VSADARRPLPTTGAMRERLTAGAVDGGADDRDLPERQRTRLY